MISVEEARSRILAGLRPVSAEMVPIAEAWGRVSARPVESRLTQPPRDVSAMDGYAVRAADPGPYTLVGAAPAGHPWPGTLGAGEALRIFTGSVIPNGADSVVIQEDVSVDGASVSTGEPIRPGQHIRRQGQDFAAGQVLVPAGRRLTPRDVGLIAAANHPWVCVHRRPRIAILATGDEIVLPGEPLPEGGIVSSNSHALSALVRACGGIPVLLPVAGDEIEVIALAADQAAGCDMLVTTGGASVGDHDLVAQALGGRGLAMDFWKIAMRPGKPLMHGHLGTLPLLGLPGNPVSAMVCAVLFLRAAIDQLQGLAGGPPPTLRATLGADLAANDHRADHLRARLARTESGWTATAFARQDSGQMRLLAEADALILRAPHAPALKAGAEIEVIALSEVGA